MEPPELTDALPSEQHSRARNCDVSVLQVSHQQTAQVKNQSGYSQKCGAID